MKQHAMQPKILGTKTGYVIRFTCPVCSTENAIINKIPNDHFRDTRNATCEHCRKRFSVLIPDTNTTTALPYVQLYFDCKKLQ